MIDVAGIAKALGAHGSAAAVPLVAMYALFTPLEEHQRFVAESERGYILDVVEKARQEPDGPFKDTLCRTLEESIARLCAAAQDDAICVDRAMYYERAGCRR